MRNRILIRGIIGTVNTARLYENNILLSMERTFFFLFTYPVHKVYSLVIDQILSPFLADLHMFLGNGKCDFRISPVRHGYLYLSVDSGHKNSD